MPKFDIIEYMSGLTIFPLDETILNRIAIERGVTCYQSFGQLTQRDKDLLLADILFTVFVSGENIPSFQHQHGQFSTSTGSTKIDKDNFLDTMRRLYAKWGDEKLDLIPQSSLRWIQECD